MFNWLKKKKIEPQLTIDYVEQKYGIKLTYPIIFLDNKNLNDPFYYDLRNFGCSDIMSNTGWIHKDCWGADKYNINIKTGEMKKVSDGNCKTCNFYPIKKEYEDNQDIKKVRIKKLNKIDENILEDNKKT